MHPDPAEAGEGGDDSLLQRIQLLVYPDDIGEWQNIDRQPDSEARDAVYTLFDRLAAFDAEANGATGADGKIPALQFSENAQLFFNDWRSDVESRVRSDELAGTPAFASWVAKLRSLMPSLALIFHLIETVSMTSVHARSTVSLENAKLAAAWCEFLELHAKKMWSTHSRRSVPTTPNRDRVRLRRADRRQHGPDADAPRSSYEVSAVRAVPVPNQEARTRVPRRRLDHLAPYPLRIRMLRHADVLNAPPTVGDEEEDVERAQ